ncbi:MAG: hypothetical protein K6F82_05240 [Sphaerochaetaceae bacterium]|nr:hypothetical protein [Sphaerochaetaceae bacterium]
MKKAVLTLILFLIILTSISALEKFSTGVGISLTGSSDAATEVDMNFVFRPFRLKYANPFINIQSGLKLSSSGLGWSGLKAMVSLELFKSMKNPLSFIMINPGPWSPSLGGGVSLEGGRFYPYAELSLFRVLDKDYMYEWFALSATFDKTGFRTWSISLLRMTSLF